MEDVRRGSWPSRHSLGVGNYVWVTQKWHEVVQPVTSSWKRRQARTHAVAPPRRTSKHDTFRMFSRELSTLVQAEGERGMTLTSQEPIIVACAIQRARIRTHDAVLQSSRRT